MLTEAIAEICAAAETTFGGNLYNVFIGLFEQLFGSIFQTQMHDVGGQFCIVAALGEDGADAVFCQQETVHDGLTLELRVEEESLAHNNVVDVLEELLVGGCFQIGFGWWLLQPPVLIIHLFIFGDIGYLLSQQTVLPADSSVLDDDDNGDDE